MNFAQCLKLYEPIIIALNYLCVEAGKLVMNECGNFISKDVDCEKKLKEILPINCFNSIHTCSGIADQKQVHFWGLESTEPSKPF